MGSESLKSRAYTVIKQRIADCTYPPGTMLNEEQLKTELNISRTPIRDALGRLEQEHLILIKPKKGILVSSIDLDEINKIFEIRMIFEPYALENYGYRLSERQLLSQYRAFDEEEDGEDSPFLKDDAFHTMIIDTVPNQYIRQCYDVITVQNKRLRVLTGVIGKERLKNSDAEHRIIIEACLKKDWKAAADAMKDHLAQSKNSSFALVLQGTGGISGTLQAT